MRLLLTMLSGVLLLLLLPAFAESLTAQLTTLASATLLVEGRKLVGREVSREKLVQTLEGLYEFRTGLTPAITYSPNRRIGALGAYIITMNLEARRFVPLSCPGV
ncbi:MAG: hypothetical protein O7G88_02195 [bacterium]|nr:hypothetical protein [bacterium]